MFTLRLHLQVVLFLVLLVACAAPLGDRASGLGFTAWRDHTSPLMSVQSASAHKATGASSTFDRLNVRTSERMDTPALLPGGISAGPLEVISTSPASNAEEVAVGRKQIKIIIQFNHPVVPLTSVEEQRGLLQPLSFSPPLAGSGVWLNTYTYSFTPAQDLQVATEYTVKVAPLTDMLGSTLAGYSWKFKTASPAVIALYPEDNTRFAGVSEPISMTFNTAMDRASVEAQFSLVEVQTQTRVAGKFQWQGNLAKFIPDKPLAYDTVYQATLKAGAQDINQRAGTRQDTTWKFRTSRQPGVLSTKPKHGEKNATSIRNGFQIDFASPMAQDAVTVTIQPTITNQYMYWENPTRATIAGNWLASETYTVTIHAESETRYGEKLGKDTVIVFTAAPLEPSVYLNVAGMMGMYDANQEQMIYATYVNVERIDFALYRVPPRELLRLVGSDRYSVWESYRPSKTNLLREWTVEVEAPLNASRVVSTTLAGETPSALLEPGVYYIEATGFQVHPHSRSRHILIVTPYHLALKRGDTGDATEALVWATDLKQGKPVADLPITLYDAQARPVASGKTDRDGVWRARFKRQEFWEPIFALSEGGDTVIAAVGSDWSEGIQTFDFNLQTQYGAQEYYANLYTDRPIYRPGQMVYFKGILRRDHDARYTLPSELKTVPIQVFDPNGRAILKQDVPLSPYGTFNGQVQLSQAAPLGFYSLVLEFGREPRRFYSSVEFQVAQYRRPEFQVEVTTDKNEYINGETIRVTANATYFFGGPVADAAVTWRLLSDDLFFTTDKVKGYWDFVDYDLTSDRPRTGGVIREGKGRTDKQGRFTFNVPADLKDYPLSQNFTIDVEVTDINNQAVSNRVLVPVHKGAFYIGLRPQRYVGEVNEKQTLDILTVTPQGDPHPHQPVTISFYQRTWYSVREKREDGNFYWRSAYTDTLTSKVEVETDDRGAATATFTPTVGGVYRIVAEGSDKQGNLIRSGTYQWIATAEFVNWRIENNDRIELVADKREYNVGETAEVLIPAPFRDSEALLTLERGGILQVKRLTLIGNSETVSIPITEDLIPTAYVSVMLVKGRTPDSPTPQFKLGYAVLNVNPTEKILNVKITPDRSAGASGLAEYKPGDRPTLTIEVIDAQGKPVQAEFSVALVDKAVQSLAAERATALDQAFWGTRGIGVQTAASWVRSIERINQTVQAEAKGGGGGPGEAETSPVRRNFQDTAFWQADVVTDANGRATVTVTLPDNLTTWNLTAKGVTKETLVGTGRLDILSTKPLLLRPVIPRFFVPGDQVTLQAVVNNNTDQDIGANVQLVAEGLELQANATQPLTVKARDKAQVTFPVIVDAVDQVVVKMSVVGGGYDDAVEVTLPVVRPAAEKVVGTAGTVADKLVEKIILPPNADPTAGGLEITLSPSLAAATRQSLNYLQSFPYECSEQTVSKFFPNVVTYRALQQLGVDDPALANALALNVSGAIQRLYQLQQGDGGWGWWANGASNPHLTAYALYALWTAQQAGFPVDENTLQRAQNFLNEYLDKPVDVRGYDFDERAFVLFVLNEISGNHGARALNLYDRRVNLSHFAKAYLMMTLAKSGNTSQAKALEAELDSAAIPSATGTHWEEKQKNFYLMNTDTRSTAIILYALARVDPRNALLPNAVRWLMTERKQGHWETTQETAWAVLGLTEYMLATGELDANYAYQVALNGNALAQDTVSQANVAQEHQVTVPIQKLLQDTANELALERTEGPGNLYYSAFLRYYLPVEQIKALDRGILVMRQYLAVDQATLKPTARSVTTARVGEYVQVKLTIIAPTDLSYVVLEDPLPAGFEAIDTTLRTTSAAAAAPALQEIAECTNCGDYYQPYWYYWAHSELRDDRVALFADFLGRGTYEYSYLMRAGVAGEFHALPTTAYQMYFPDVFGRGEGAKFVVTE